MTYKEEINVVNYKRKTILNKTLFIVASVIVGISAFVMIFPYVYMVVSALKSQKEILSSSSVLTLTKSATVMLKEVV